VNKIKGVCATEQIVFDKRFRFDFILRQRFVCVYLTTKWRWEKRKLIVSGSNNKKKELPVRSICLTINLKILVSI